MSKESKYRAMTNELVEIIKKSVEDGNGLPWRRTWTQQGIASFPFNYVSMRPYSGINTLVLWCAASKKGYSSMAWLTMRQVNELGGSVIKGEKATRCIYVKPIFEADENNDDSEKVNRTMVKYYHLFNTEQCTGLPEGADLCHKTGSIDFDSMLEKYQNESKITYVFGTDQPAYRAFSDTIQMPREDVFDSKDDYIAVFAHELIHSTGHSTRLDRNLTGINPEYTNKDYAFEELIAELGSAYLCTELNVVSSIENHASYLQSWLKALENDEKFIFKAAAAAQKAVSHITQYSLTVGSTEDELLTA